MNVEYTPQSKLNIPDLCDSTSFRKGFRVLVVDSHADSRDLLIMFFREYGIETIAAACISESLELMQQTCPDVLISEIVLPDGDGYALMSKVKDFESNYNVQIPSIALTTRVRDSDRIHALSAGFCKHLSKPLNLDELLATVTSVTEQATLVETASI